MTPNQQPLVSVIVPVYNGATFLMEAIESIWQQTYHPVEIIIVDDGSTDNGPQIIESFGNRVQSVRQQNSGPAAARNAGLQIARGDIIGFLDADDLWPADKLSVQMQCLSDNPHIEMVMGQIQVIELPDATRNEHRFNIDQETAVNLHLGGALFRASVFDKVGKFDERMRYSEDVDLFMRIREHNIPIAIVESVTLYYRLHEHNMTHTLAEVDRYLLLAFKKSLDRRRQAHGNAHNLPTMENFERYPIINPSINDEP